jgi:hypothetical protein
MKMTRADRVGQLLVQTALSGGSWSVLNHLLSMT